MKPDYTKQIINTIKVLKKEHPSYNIGRHISTAFDGYGDLWNVTDKEFAFALKKYEVELGLDIPHEKESDLAKIIEDGMHLDTLMSQEEDEDY